MLTIAASGARKSTCDGHFTQAIRTYEAEHAEAFKPVLEAYRADFEAWEMEQAGIRMGRKPKSTAAAKPDESPGERNARVALQPSVNAAAVLHSYSGKMLGSEPDINFLIKGLLHSSATANGGDLATRPGNRTSAFGRFGAAAIRIK